MQIHRIEVNGFGKLAHYALSLHEGLQVIYGANEEGKSTLMSFIKLMLYGNDGRSKSLRDLRQRNRPWSGAEMGGAIELTHKGTRYRLQKRFGSRAGQDQIELLNMDTGAPVALGKEESVGEHFLGISLSEFERSCFISHTLAICSQDKQGSDLSQYMSNLTHSGDADVSPQVVLERLARAKEALISKSGKTGLLVQKKAQRQSLLSQQQQVSQLLDEQSDTRKTYQALLQQRDRVLYLQKQREAVRARKSLKQLDMLQQQFEALVQHKRALERPELPFARLPDFVARLEKDERAYRALLGGLHGLRAQAGIPPALHVSEADERRARMLQQAQLDCATLEEQLRNLLDPAWQSYAAQKKHAVSIQAQAQEKQALVEASAPEEALRQDLQTRLAQTEKERADTASALQNRRELDLRDRALAQQRLALAKSKADAEAARLRASRPSPALPVGAALLSAAVVGVACGTGQLWLLAALVLPAALLGMYFVKRSRASVAPPVHTDWDEAQQAARQQEAQARLQQDALGEKARRLAAQHAQIEQDLAALSPKLEARQALLQAQAQLELEAARAQSALDTARMNLQQQYQRLRKTAAPLCEKLRLPALPEELRQFSRGTWLQTVQQSARQAQAQLDALLAEKACANLEELAHKRANSAAEARVQASLSQMEQQVRDAAQALCATASLYDQTDTPAQAAALLQRLQEALSACVTMQSKATGTANALGVQAPARIVPLRAALEQKAAACAIHDEAQVQALEQELAAADPQALSTQIQALQARLRTPERLPEQFAPEIQALSEEIDDMQRYYDSLCLAEKYMQAAAEDLRRTFSPELDRVTGTIFGALTGQKYSKVMVSQQYEMHTMAQGDFHQADALSAGTMDQAYLALRLAVSQMLAQKCGPLPLILDDVLMQYDDVRTKNTLAFLKRYAIAPCAAQMILFTCHESIADMAKQMQIPVLRLQAGAAKP